MTEIHHLVFDLGNVLIRWDPEKPFLKLIPDEAERYRFLNEICSPAWNHQQDRGRGWREAEDELIARFPQHEAMIRSYRRLWPEMIPGVFEDSVAIVERLIDSGLDVTALTNWAADTFELARARFPFLARFRGVTVSAQVGLAKPEAAIFRHHSETFGLVPERTLFLDDNPENVRAARDLGWRAEVFTDAQSLQADIARYGIDGG
jgi:2-haloacid dehalogenase